ncbi:Protein of unknown function [Cyclobacterium xiamenense]|uniref:DUF3823 domain-containing protein n=1 Tax=Cyclobacterium xiamenense TaxID=1297121 RepID=A0A1H7A5Z3_9BACT|nr:DUF3823 domain-containing protein [Cyclobacterium xiamenense]SEJ61031.1 Protein of unknown function [Cyclobacterium xiamenense]
MNGLAFKKYLMLVAMPVSLAVFSGCEEIVTDFGFDGQISGLILDQNGDPVSGDASNPAFTVFVLGEEDRVPLELRVNGDGSYANLHLYPQNYTVWVEGPVDGPGQGELTVDLRGRPVEQHITVNPFLVIPPPTVSVSGGEVQVNYSISPSQGHGVQERVVLVSTVAKVGVNTGNGPRWQTRELELPENSGTATVTLDANLLAMSRERGGGNLHIRIAARSDQTTDWNHSLPIVIPAP